MKPKTEKQREWLEKEKQRILSQQPGERRLMAMAMQKARDKKAGK